MVFRGGMVIGGLSPAMSEHAESAPDVQTAAPARRSRRFRLPLGIVVVAMLLTLIPGRAKIPPLVQSDYAYMLIAANRLHDGLGYSSLQPNAPLQPWTWRSDFGWLSQWPPAYPWTIVAVRKATGWSAMEASRHLSTLFTAMALVGWFALIKRTLPGGLTATVLAAVGAAQAVSAAMLIDPSTDLLLCAAIPYVLMLVPLSRKGDSWMAWALAGLAAGGLFWIRYASLFVPVGIGGVLLLSLWWRCVRLSQVALFSIFAAVPIVGLVLLNRLMSSGGSAAETLNLGTQVGFDFSFEMCIQAWWRMTDLGFYDHLWFSRWVISLWPVVAGGLLIVPAVRRRVRAYVSIPAVGLCLALAVCLPIMLILATTLFKGKFDYVGLDRYYLPLRPLYFLLFVGPLLLIPQKWPRAILLVGLCIAGSWTVQQSWGRAYQRHLGADRPVTALGQRSVCFNPDAIALYDWLGEQADPSLIVISNFHDYITLETGIPALPPPSDEAALHGWIDRIVQARAITQPRVLFVLDPDNGYRDYFLPDPAKLVEGFALTPVEGAPPSISKWAYEYHPTGTPAALAASASAG